MKDTLTFNLLTFKLVYSLIHLLNTGCWLWPSCTLRLWLLTFIPSNLKFWLCCFESPMNPRYLIYSKVYHHNIIDLLKLMQRVWMHTQVHKCRLHMHWGAGFYIRNLYMGGYCMVWVAMDPKHFFIAWI